MGIGKKSSVLARVCNIYNSFDVDVLFTKYFCGNVVYFSFECILSGGNRKIHISG